MSAIDPVNEKKVFEAMIIMKGHLEEIGLNEHERIVLLKNLASHEETTLDRKNAATAMFAALRKIGL